MRRPGWMLAGAMVLSLLPVTVSGCSIACACSSTADPNWTPPPVTAQEAAIFGAKVAGVSAMTAEMIGGPSGSTFYLAAAPNTLALVDAVGGNVVEVVLEDRMPNAATVSVSTADARSAAEAFMRRTGLDTEAFSESVQLVQRAGVAAYEVKWKESGGSAVAKFSLSVNASTAYVFAFVDLRMQLNLAAPMLGRERATGLAIAAIGVPGETVTSAELAITFTTGSQQSLWEVGLGVPTATQADVFEHGALVAVDAVTGEAMIVKS